METSKKEPQCDICQRNDEGIQYPIFPKTQGFMFGSICARCDEGHTPDWIAGYTAAIEDLERTLHVFTANR